MLDDFEFSAMLGYTKNYNDLHDILITILKNDNVEQFFSLCKCVKQHPFTLTLKQVSIFDIALMHQAINIATEFHYGTSTRHADRSKTKSN